MNDFNYNFCSYDPRHPDYGMIKEIAIFHDLPEPKVEKDCSCDSCFNGSHKLACTIESLQASLKAAEAKIEQLEKASDLLMKSAVKRINDHTLQDRIKTLDAKIELRDKVISEALAGFKCTQRPENYPDDHWSNKAKALTEQDKQDLLMFGADEQALENSDE